METIGVLQRDKHNNFYFKLIRKDLNGYNEVYLIKTYKKVENHLKEKVVL